MNKTLVKEIRHEISIILDEESGRGIIHCVSYALGDTLRDLSDRLIFHGSTDKEVQFQKFINTPGSVFVSPSSTRGVDLKGELARWAVILKCPYLSLGDYHIQQRLFNSGKWGQMWYSSQAIDNIVQASGRIVRDFDDYGTVYILDMQVGKLLQKNANLFPRWYRDAIEYE